MSPVPPSRRLRARFRRPRLPRAACSLILLGLLLAATAGLATRRSFLARRSAREAPGYRYVLVGNPADVVRPSRTGLVLEGGGPDLDESFHWLIERSSGGDFLVLRTSGTDAYNDYIFDLTAPGGRRADSVATLIMTSRAASYDPFVIGAIRGAEALWIAGGDQSKHVAMWLGTPVADAINDLVARGVPVGGTSSGLAVMGEYVYSADADGVADAHLSSTQALRDPYHPRVTIRRGLLRLPRLDGVLLEPHFVQESRYGRMAALLARVSAERARGEVRGIGIDRKTALIVEPDGSARVITGADHRFGSATFFRFTGRPEVCEPGLPLTVRGIEALEFGPGDRPDLSRWGGEGGRSFRLSVVEGVPTIERLIK
jgi:cyanophycinase